MQNILPFNRRFCCERDTGFGARLHRFAVADYAPKIVEVIKIRFVYAVIFCGGIRQKFVDFLLLGLVIRLGEQAERRFLWLQFLAGGRFSYPERDTGSHCAEHGDSAESYEKSTRSGYVVSHVSS